MIDEQVLALAGIVQPLAQVRQLSLTGTHDTHILKTGLDSLLRFDAASTTAVYGTTRALIPGLQKLQAFFAGQRMDDELRKLVIAVLQLERRFLRHDTAMMTMREGLISVKQMVNRLGNSTDPQVITALATLYMNTLSRLRPQIMITGNPTYLAEPMVAASIRALLLCAIRSTVLWRQLDGKLWHFLFSKQALSVATQHALRH